MAIYCFFTARHWKRFCNELAISFESAKQSNPEVYGSTTDVNARATRQTEPSENSGNY
jgi:hypothetical protein